MCRQKSNRHAGSKDTHRISRVLEIIMAGALSLGASDVHLEPEETQRAHALPPRRRPRRSLHLRRADVRAHLVAPQITFWTEIEHQKCRARRPLLHQRRRQRDRNSRERIAGRRMRKPSSCVFWIRRPSRSPWKRSASTNTSWKSSIAK